MTVIDRYLTWMFLKIFLVCFLSFTGLFVIIHLFSNLDELAELGQIIGWEAVLRDFYGPRVAEVFDKTAAVWTLVAAVFAVNLMQRRREMTAIEAVGITKSRILRPVMICAVLIVGLGIVNREFVIPQNKDLLVRTPQNWDNQDALPMGTFHDLRSGIKIRGDTLSLHDKKITQVKVQIPGREGQPMVEMKAAWADVEPASKNHPAGLLLHQVSLPDELEVPVSLKVDGRPVVQWPETMPSLTPGQCFVDCDFDAYKMAYGNKLENYQSTKEMLVELRKPRIWYGKDLQIKAHARMLRPVLELTLLMLGLPLAIKRIDKNIFISAGICFLVLGGIQLSIIACHSLGSYSIIEPVALAVWLPVIIFLPLAVVAIWRINR